MKPLGICELLRIIPKLVKRKGQLLQSRGVSIYCTISISTFFLGKVLNALL